MDEQNDYKKQNIENTEPTPPVLDKLIRSRELQMLKSIVPYMELPQQRMISLIIKIAELQKTIRLFDGEPEIQAAELHCCENESPTERTYHMLCTVREYCTPSEQETVDTFLNFFDMYLSYESLFADADGM